MKIVCLMENTAGNGLCQCEHGLSLYIEMENSIVLADTGASGLFLENAKKLGVDVTKVDTLFLSHGHYDHGGGILGFVERNPNAKIVMQRSALGNYWHKSEEVEKYIGLDPNIKELKNLILLDGDYSSNKFKIFILSTKKQEEFKCWPEGNLVLKERKDNEFWQDSFNHEQYLVLEEKGKKVLISGCAHNGILNIVEEYKERYHSYPDVIVSGFHMRKKNGYTEHDFQVIKETAKELKKTGIKCYTGHCTSDVPYELMKEIMGEQLSYLHCGENLEIG